MGYFSKETNNRLLPGGKADYCPLCCHKIISSNPNGWSRLLLNNNQVPNFRRRPSARRGQKSSWDQGRVQLSLDELTRSKIEVETTENMKNCFATLRSIHRLTRNSASMYRRPPRPPPRDLGFMGRVQHHHCDSDPPLPARPPITSSTWQSCKHEHFPFRSKEQH